MMMTSAIHSEGGLGCCRDVRLHSAQSSQRDSLRHFLLKKVAKHELLEIWFDLVDDSLHVTEASGEQMAFLQNVSDLDNSVSQYAEAMLLVLGVDTVYHEIELPESGSSKRGSRPYHHGDAPWLGQNIPNPFDGSTMIPVFVPEGIGVLRVYDLHGRLVWWQDLRAGLTHVVISETALPKGTYAYTLMMKDKAVSTRKMIKQ